jgi:acyl-CoA thioesterase
MEAHEREAESLEYDVPLPTPMQFLLRQVEVMLRRRDRLSALGLIEQADMEKINPPENLPEPEREPTEAELFENFRKHPRSKNERFARVLRCKLETVAKARKAYAALRHHERMAETRKRARKQREANSEAAAQ